MCSGMCECTYAPFTKSILDDSAWCPQRWSQQDAADLEDVMMASMSKACLSKLKGSSLGPETCALGSARCGAASPACNLATVATSMCKR